MAEHDTDMGQRPQMSQGPRTSGSAISRGLDQELPFGAGDNVSADDDLAGDIDLQL
jgi:hypothetical protein